MVYAMHHIVIYVCVILLYFQCQTGVVLSSLCPVQARNINEDKVDKLETGINDLKNIQDEMERMCEAPSSTLCSQVHHTMSEAFKQLLPELKVYVRRLQRGKDFWQILEFGTWVLSIVTGLKGIVLVSVPSAALNSNFKGRKQKCESAHEEIEQMNDRFLNLIEFFKNFAQGITNPEINDWESPCSPYEIGEEIHNCSDLYKKITTIRGEEDEISKLIQLRKRNAPIEEIQAFFADSAVSWTTGFFISHLAFLWGVVPDQVHSYVSESLGQITSKGIEVTKSQFADSIDKCKQHLKEYTTIDILEAKLHVLKVVSTKIGELYGDQCKATTLDRVNPPQTLRDIEVLCREINSLPLCLFITSTTAVRISTTVFISLCDTRHRSSPNHLFAEEGCSIKV